MGSAVVSAILNGEFEPYPTKIICCTNSEALSKKLSAKFNNAIVEHSFGGYNKSAVEKADIVILGCKPYHYRDVYDQIGGRIWSDRRKFKIVISLMAGITIEQLEIFSPYVARVMTNTPAQFGCGMATVAFSPRMTPDKEEWIMKLVNPIGKAVKIPEKNMDALTALVGSGPAFCLLMMEALIDGGVRMGLPYDIAKECAAKVMEGTGKMVLESGEHPAALKSKICTPAGTTIGGLLKLEDLGVRGAISRAIEESTIISQSFANK